MTTKQFILHGRRSSRLEVRVYLPQFTLLVCVLNVLAQTQRKPGEVLSEFLKIHCGHPCEGLEMFRHLLLDLSCSNRRLPV